MYRRREQTREVRLTSSTMYHAAKHLPNSITNYEYYKKRMILMEDEQYCTALDLPLRQ